MYNSNWEGYLDLVNTTVKTTEHVRLLEDWIFEHITAIEPFA